MYLNQFFTEYDETITQSLNIDPLGMTMIWSSLGQAIFNNRVSSISNDVRNYTLNLVHHYVIKSLVDSTDAKLSGELEKVYGQIDSLAFKQTCLIFLENVFVFSMLAAESTKGVQTQGILGASNARLKISQDTAKRTPNAPLLFTRDPQGQLLVRQLTLGVSGRYKTPFIELSFFDKALRYHQPHSVSQWENAQAFISSHNGLRQLAETSVAFLKTLIKQTHSKPSVAWQDIPEDIKRQYVACFASSEVVGSYSKDFWLKVTALDQNASGSLYQAISELSCDHSSAQMCFEHALELETDEQEKKKLNDICQVEPFLAECELLFTVLMSQKLQTETEVYDTYCGLKRHVDSIISLASRLTHLVGSFSGSASRRFNALLSLGKLSHEESQHTMTALVDRLLEYHGEIMAQRGQSPWVEKDRQGNYRCYVTLRSLPEPVKRPYKSWHHKYYLDQFSQLIRGLEGKGHDANI
ncbi:hypothetical protein [Marinomonas sp.]